MRRPERRAGALRVVVADDQPIVRLGIERLLATEVDLQLIAWADCASSALQAIAQHRADAAVLDLDMPNGGGLEVARRLAENGGGTSAILFGDRVEREDVAAAMAAQVAGYVYKEDPLDALIAALRSAARGEVYYSPRVLRITLDLLRDGGSALSTLTRREREVLRLICDGLRSKEIAQQLGLTAKTVDGYRESLMDKLGIHSIAGLVKYAIKNRISSL